MLARWDPQFSSLHQSFFAHGRLPIMGVVPLQVVRESEEMCE